MARTGVSRPGPLVIELVGVSGSGKSTACEELIRRNGEAARSWISVHERTLRSSVLPRCFLPVARWRYRKVLAHLPKTDGRRWFRVRTAFAFVSKRGIVLWRSKNVRVSMLFMLSTLVMELAFARIEARLRRRTLVIDEGPVQRAVGLWLRSPPALRGVLLRAYFETLPSESRCVIVRCDPEVAQRRASARERGLPLPAMRAARALRGEGSKAESYAALGVAQAELIDGIAGCERVQARVVEPGSTVAETTERVAEGLRALGATGPILVLFRE